MRPFLAELRFPFHSIQSVFSNLTLLRRSSFRTFYFSDRVEYIRFSFANLHIRIPRRCGCTSSATDTFRGRRALSRIESAGAAFPRSSVGTLCRPQFRLTAWYLHSDRPRCSDHCCLYSSSTLASGPEFRRRIRCNSSSLLSALLQTRRRCASYLTNLSMSSG